MPIIIIIIPSIEMRKRAPMIIMMTLASSLPFWCDNQIHLTNPCPIIFCTTIILSRTTHLRMREPKYTLLRLSPFKLSHLLHYLMAITFSTMHFCPYHFANNSSNYAKLSKIIKLADATTIQNKTKNSI